MPKKSPTPRPRNNFQGLALEEQVRRAIPVARELLIEGIDYGQRRDDLSTTDHVQQLVQDQKLAKVIASGCEDEYVPVENWLEAARAIGIALGLMLRSDLFLQQIGGGR